MTSIPNLFSLRSRVEEKHANLNYLLVDTSLNVITICSTEHRVAYITEVAGNWLQVIGMLQENSSSINVAVTEGKK